MMDERSKVRNLIIWLGVYMLLMGVVGFLDTGSTVPIFISGGLGAITALFGFFIGRGLHAFARIGVIWLVCMTGLMGYMTFGRISAHANPTPLTSFIFGSMGLFSLVALVHLIRWRIRQ
jgi:uncharacterized membrane protein